MANFRSAESVREELDMLIGKRPPLVKEIGRAPGQREARFAHLLSGDVVATAPEPRALAASPASDLEERVRVLEEQVAELRALLAGRPARPDA